MTELSARPGKVFLIGAGPGDPGLLTLRGREILERAQVVVFDRLVHPDLLKYASQAMLIDVGKQPNHHPIPQHEINQLLIHHARSGKLVARLKGGDPFVFGRGGEEALALRAAGIPYEVVPGVSSAIAVPAYAGIPVTHRNLAYSVTILTGHRAEADLEGQLPGPESSEGANPLPIHWKALVESSQTLVFLMGVQNLPTIVNHLLQAGMPPETPAAVIQNGTLPDQKVFLATLGTLLEEAAHVRAPAITVIGAVARFAAELGWFPGNSPAEGEG